MGGQVPSCTLLCFPNYLQVIEDTFTLTRRARRERLEVVICHREAGMAEDAREAQHVIVLCHEVDGEGVPEAVRVHRDVSDASPFPEAVQQPMQALWAQRRSPFGKKRRPFTSAWAVHVSEGVQIPREEMAGLETQADLSLFVAFAGHDKKGIVPGDMDGIESEGAEFVGPDARVQQYGEDGLIPGGLLGRFDAHVAGREQRGDMLGREDRNHLGIEFGHLEPGHQVM